MSGKAYRNLIGVDPVMRVSGRDNLFEKLAEAFGLKGRAIARMVIELDVRSIVKLYIVEHADSGHLTQALEVLAGHKDKIAVHQVGSAEVLDNGGRVVARSEWVTLPNGRPFMQGWVTPPLDDSQQILDMIVESKTGKRLRIEAAWEELDDGIDTTNFEGVADVRSLIGYLRLPLPAPLVGCDSLAAQVRGGQPFMCRALDAWTVRSNGPYTLPPE